MASWAAGATGWCRESSFAIKGSDTGDVEDMSAHAGAGAGSGAVSGAGAARRRGGDVGDRTVGFSIGTYNFWPFFSTRARDEELVTAAQAIERVLDTAART